MGTLFRAGVFRSPRHRQPVLVEFTANWCGNCLALEASVYHDKKTAAAIHDHRVILLRADLTSENALAGPWSTNSTPAAESR